MKTAFFVVAAMLAGAEELIAAAEQYKAGL